MLESIQLFLIVWIANDNVPSYLVEFTEVIDFRDNILKREIFGRRGFGPFFFGVFILLLRFLGSRFALFRLWVVSRCTVLVLLDSPASRLLLKIDSEMIEDHRENILGVEKTAFGELFELSF